MSRVPPDRPSANSIDAVIRILELYGFEFLSDIENDQSPGRWYNWKRLPEAPTSLDVFGIMSPGDDPLPLAELVDMGVDLSLVLTGAPPDVKLIPQRPSGADNGEVDESDLHDFDEVRRYLDDVHVDHGVDVRDLESADPNIVGRILKATMDVEVAEGVRLHFELTSHLGRNAQKFHLRIDGLSDVETATPSAGSIPRPWLAFLPTDGKGRRVSFRLAHQFRAMGLECRIAPDWGDIDVMLGWCDRGGARWSVELGGDELLGKGIEVLDWGEDRGVVADMNSERIKEVFKQLFEGTPMTTGDID